MIEIQGKVLLFTDIHFGVKSNSLNRLKICADVISSIKKYMMKNKIKNCIFAGDWMHDRNNLNVQTLDVAYRCLESIASVSNVYFILGNHDIFKKNSNEISSANIFKDIKNVHIITNATEISINGNKTILIPWFSDLTKYDKKTFDMAIGHFDICTEYLLASYIEDNSERLQASEKYTELINSDDLLEAAGLGDIDFSQENIEDTIVNQRKSSELIGNWIEIVKEKGVIFSGHIHNRKEFFSKKRKFVFIGSPYQQNMGEIKSKDGFYVINEDNTHEFHKLEGIPVHVDIKMSEVLNNIEGYDFSKVKGNIVHKIYDVDVDRMADVKISRIISDNMPFDEINPDYTINNDKEHSSNNGDETLEMIRKSKIEYLRNYIYNIRQEILDKEELDKETLISTITDYYEKADI